MKTRIISNITILFCLIIGWILNDVWENHQHKFIKPLESNINHDFFIFYDKFSSDSVFQKEHITTPLPYEEWILEHWELYKKEQKSNITFIKLPNQINTSVYDNYDLKMNGKRRLLKIDGNESILYYFEFENDDWYLKKVEKYI
jgi:hypothetical protein